MFRTRLLKREKLKKKLRNNFAFFCSGNYPPELFYKHNQKIQKRGGICIETEQKKDRYYRC